MQELTYQDLKTAKEVTEHFDVPPVVMTDLEGNEAAPPQEAPVQLTGIQVQVKDDPANRAVLLIVGDRAIHVTLEGAHKLAAALNQSANRVGNKLYEQQRQAKRAAREKKAKG